MTDDPLPFSETDLHQWDLLGHFRQRLLAPGAAKLHPSWSDPKRHAQDADYLSLFLFGLLHPALRTMRALCAASLWERVRREVCTQSRSRGSFSEAQHLVEPAALEQIFGDLVAAVPGPVPAEPRAAWQQWFARDSSLFAARPRLSWALDGGGKAGAKNNAVRLHLSFHLLDDKPARAPITPGQSCERKVWRTDWQAGAADVGDRSFAEHDALLGEWQERGCRYVLRLCDKAVVNVEEELPVSAAERAAGVTRQVWARLGARPAGRSERERVVWIALAAGGDLRLVPNVSPDDLDAAEVGLLDRRRWQIECFFRWLKCLLGCRHWLAESERGVTIQLYLALIASVLLPLATGRRPDKRLLELIQMDQLGWASLAELEAGVARAAAAARKKSKSAAPGRLRSSRPEGGAMPRDQRRPGPAPRVLLARR